ncbi:MAG TPA: hypothetical protein VMC79_09220 [Rectinemataceae bacterium]|nr:hypothetical protein [Rectinemataceae bacterium]
MAGPSVVESIKAALGRLLEALPFAKRKLPSAPEPFSSIEDSSPNADLLMSANAAPGLAGRQSAKPDFRAAFEALSHRKGVLLGVAVVLGFVLVLAITAIIVGAPPPPPAAAPHFDREGEALVRQWLVPPGSALEPRMEMERETMPHYSAKEAFTLGVDPAEADVTGLQESNDARLNELFRTVR